MYKFLILLISALTVCSCAERVDQSRKISSSILIPHENMEGCESPFVPCDTILVERYSPGEDLSLVFPAEGAQTYLLLYDEATLKKIAGSQADPSIRPLRADTVYNLERLPTISLKDLSDGTYCVHIHSGKYGKFKWVLVKTGE